MRLIAVSSILASVIDIVIAFPLFSIIKCGIYVYFISTTLVYFSGIAYYLASGYNLAYLHFHGIKGSTYSSMLSYSLRWLNTLFWWAAQSINRFFITGMLGIAASGLFAAASQLSSFLNLISSILQQAWNVSAFQENDGKDRSNIYDTVFPIYIYIYIC